MDPAQGESGGGRSLTSKLKAKVPHTRVKDKVKNLKNRLPGMKKHNGDDDAHDDSSEYDDGSPTGPGPETGYNVGESTPFTNVKATPDSNFPRSEERLSPREVQHNPDDNNDASRPAQTGYDSQNRNYVSAAPPTRPAPLATDSPRSNLAPPLEEKFKHLNVEEKPPQDATDRSSQPEQQSPSITESVQKGYSDNSYRSNPATSAPTTPTGNKGILEKVQETVASATAVLGDKMGYYNDHTPASPRDPNAPSILDKAKSVLGVDKPRDPNAPPLTERAKQYMSVASQKTREYSATTADRAAWTKDRVAAQATPTHHDKALSEQVSQSLSNLPGAIKAKVFGPASPSTPRGANPPASPGIVDRVSGVVSSLFTTASPKATTGEHVHHTSPDAAPAAAPPPFADRSSAPETMPATATPPVNN